MVPVVVFVAGFLTVVRREPPAAAVVAAGDTIESVELVGVLLDLGFCCAPV
jgi:hypothetical protein